MQDLKDLIDWLEQQNLEAVMPHGFCEPGSYRGYYDELAFEPAEDVTLGEMLMHARNALDKTFTGYKGGEYTMTDCTPVWIAPYGSSVGDKIGPTMLKLWEHIAKSK